MVSLVFHFRVKGPYRWKLCTKNERSTGFLIFVSGSSMLSLAIVCVVCSLVGAWCLFLVFEDAN